MTVALIAAVLGSVVILPGILTSDENMEESPGIRDSTSDTACCTSAVCQAQCHECMRLTDGTSATQ